MKKLIPLLFLLVLGQELQGQDQILISSHLIPDTDTVWVFTPSDYAEGQKYPVVYMLHGYSSDYQQWHKIMDAVKYANDYDIIIVCPDGFYNSWYINSPRKSESQFASYFFEKLIPAIEEKYAADTENRFVTGLSMGGHGAFHLFSLRPDLFKSAGSTSGVMDLRGSAGLFELHEYLGEYEENQDLWLSVSAIGNIEKFKNANKELIFDCGTEDPFFRWNMDFYRKALEANVPVTFISQPGKHEWDYWEKSIKAHFEFFKAKSN